MGVRRCDGAALEDDDVARARIGELMARMARGEVEALLDFVREFGSSLRRVVRTTVFGYGRRDVLDGDGLEELVLVAGFALFDRASGWDPAGAPPWVWADRAIRSALAAHIGHATTELDGDRLDVPAAGTSPAPAALHGDAVDVIERLARVDDRAWMWWQAVSLFATERDRTVYFEYELQRALGDWSPANTVAAQTHLQRANVRQIVRRVRTRLAEVIDTDDRFAALRTVDWFAA